MIEKNKKQEHVESEDQASHIDENTQVAEEQDDTFSPLESGPETALFWQ
ncbi:hypothetical protein [Photobacterium galatheae]|nr:hypothetical protein [Photobacterium galatheae]MCM0149967.1 hypothetical protein [Photobacterium galatheae]